jgi:hypothetical protein
LDVNGLMPLLDLILDVRPSLMVVSIF